MQYVSIVYYKQYEDDYDNYETRTHTIRYKVCKTEQEGLDYIHKLEEDGYCDKNGQRNTDGYVTGDVYELCDDKNADEYVKWFYNDINRCVKDN